MQLVEQHLVSCGMMDQASGPAKKATPKAKGSASSGRCGRQGGAKRTLRAICSNEEQAGEAEDGEEEELALDVAEGGQPQAAGKKNACSRSRTARPRPTCPETIPVTTATRSWRRSWTKARATARS